MKPSAQGTSPGGATTRSAQASAAANTRAQVLVVMWYLVVAVRVSHRPETAQGAQLSSFFESSCIVVPALAELPPVGLLSAQLEGVAIMSAAGGSERDGPARRTGVVKWFSFSRGYGFITQKDDNEEFFVHQVRGIATACHQPTSQPRPVQHHHGRFPVVETRRDRRV